MTASELGQVDGEGAYLNDNDKAEDTDKIFINTDSSGVANIKVIFGSEVESVNVTLTPASPYDEDENGFLQLDAAEENTGLVLTGANEQYYQPGYVFFTFTGEAKSLYTITLSESASDATMINVSSNKGTLGETPAQSGTFNAKTNANGVAYVRISSSSNIDNFSVSMTYAGEIPPEKEPLYSEDFTITSEDLVPDDFMGAYYKEITFTATESGTYKFEVENAGTYWIYDSLDAYYDMGDECTTLTLTEGEEYTLYVVIDGSAGAGDYTFKAVEVAGSEASMPTVYADPATGVCEFTIEEGDYTDPISYNYVVEISFTPETSDTYTLSVVGEYGECDLYASISAMNDGMSIYEPQTLVAGTEYKYYISVFNEGDYTFTATVSEAE